MAQIVTITNPITGQPVQVDQLDHTAQQIDDAVSRALPGGYYDKWVSQLPGQNLLDNSVFVDGCLVDQRGGYVVPPGTTVYEETSLSTIVGPLGAYYTVIEKTSTYAKIKADEGVALQYWYAPASAAVRGYTGAGYGPDRWICNGVVISDNGLTFTAQAAYIVQPIEAWKKEALDGKTITISALLSNGELVAGSNVYTAASSENVYFAVGKVQLLIQTNGNLLVLADTQATVEAIKFELGTHQTIAHQDANGNWQLNELPNYADTLARCKRYFERGTVGSTAPLPHSGVLFMPGHSFEVEKRATPNVRIFGWHYSTPDNWVEGQITDANGLLTTQTVNYANVDKYGIVNLRMSAALDAAFSYSYGYEASADL